MHLRQPLHRVLDLTVNGHAHGGHQVTSRLALIVGTVTDRNHGHGRELRGFVLALQIFAKSPGNHGHEHVVDGDARYGAPYRLDLVEIEETTLYHPV